MILRNSKEWIGQIAEDYIKYVTFCSKIQKETIKDRHIYVVFKAR